MAITKNMSNKTDRKPETNKNGEEESEQLQCGADVVEVRLLALDSDKYLVKPGQLQVGVRPNVGTQCLLEYRHTTTRQKVRW